VKSSKSISTFHGSNRRWSIHQGDVQQVIPTLSPNLHDGVVTDGPYGIRFMENDWDSAVPPVFVWQGLLRACKPGAFLLAFGSPKTFHRLFCNVEDAGWEIRDTICWLYGSAKPPGRDISKAIDKEQDVQRPIVGERQNLHRGSNVDHRFGYAKSDVTIPVTAPASDAAKNWEGYHTTLKPAWEPILLAQKPRRGTFAKNALQFGCGGLNINGCRIEVSSTLDEDQLKRTGQINEGRWPANLILDEEAARQLDHQSGHSRSQRGTHRNAKSNVGNGRTLNPFRSRVDTAIGYDDEGGASRFFYVAKSNKKERTGNDHPTVKPLTLCEYLGRLLLPPQRKTPRRLLVPFSGSGSEMLGALMAGWDHVAGIERDPHYVEIALRRLADLGEGAAVPA
jgi:DNA modification methylase